MIGIALMLSVAALVETGWLWMETSSNALVNPWLLGLSTSMSAFMIVVWTTLWRGIDNDHLPPSLLIQLGVSGVVTGLRDLHTLFTGKQISSGTAMLLIFDALLETKLMAGAAAGAVAGADAVAVTGWEPGAEASDRGVEFSTADAAEPLGWVGLEEGGDAVASPSARECTAESSAVAESSVVLAAVAPAAVESVARDWSSSSRVWRRPRSVSSSAKRCRELGLGGRWRCLPITWVGGGFVAGSGSCWPFSPHGGKA